MILDQILVRFMEMIAGLQYIWRDHPKPLEQSHEYIFDLLSTHFHFAAWKRSEKAAGVQQL